MTLLRSTRRDEQRLRQDLHDAFDSIDVPDDVIQRLVAGVENLSQNPTAGSPAIAATTVEPARRRWAPLLVAAAAVVVIGGAAVVATNRPAPVTPVTTTSTTQTTPSPTTSKPPLPETPPLPKTPPLPETEAPSAQSPTPSVTADAGTQTSAQADDESIRDQAIDGVGFIGPLASVPPIHGPDAEVIAYFVGGFAASYGETRVDSVEWVYTDFGSASLTYGVTNVNDEDKPVIFAKASGVFTSHGPMMGGPRDDSASEAFQTDFLYVVIGEEDHALMATVVMRDSVDMSELGTVQKSTW